MVAISHDLSNDTNAPQTQLHQRCQPAVPMPGIDVKLYAVNFKQIVREQGGGHDNQRCDEYQPARPTGVETSIWEYAEEREYAYPRNGCHDTYNRRPIR